MKNKYKIVGDIVEIYVTHKGSTIKTITDLTDIEKVKSFPNKWYAKKCGNNIYVVGHKKKNGKTEVTYLHRLIVGASPNDGYVTDHINRNTLDNRKSNLRKVTRAENAQNRVGVEGVDWAEHAKKWRARIFKKGKEHHLGYFGSYVEARKARKEAEKCLFPYSLLNQKKLA